MATTRNLKWPDDHSMLTSLDTSFTVDKTYVVNRDGLSCVFQLENISRPYRKGYKLDELPTCDWVSVALIDDKIVGIGAIKYETWNRRAILYHLYVDAKFRGRGVGRLLIEGAEKEAVKMKARCLWVETQTNNVKAIDFYVHSGFVLCGFDSSLYDDGSAAVRETAVFLSKTIV